MFYFLFSHFLIILYTIFYLKFVIYLVISEKRLRFQCCDYYRLNDFKLIGMIYCNHSSLVILVNDVKYIHFYPTFHLPPTLSHCKYKPCIKPIDLLISLQILDKTFVSNIKLNLSYNLSKYMQLEVFENCLKWVF